MVLIIYIKNASNLTKRYWDMVPDRWTDRMDQNTYRTDFLRFLMVCGYYKCVTSVILTPYYQATLTTPNMAVHRLLMYWASAQMDECTDNAKTNHLACKELIKLSYFPQILVHLMIHPSVVSCQQLGLHRSHIILKNINTPTDYILEIYTWPSVVSCQQLGLHRSHIILENINTPKLVTFLKYMTICCILSAARLTQISYNSENHKHTKTDYILEIYTWPVDFL